MPDFREAGRIISATFSRGDDTRDESCIEYACECVCHDDPPLPEGTYATVKLDRDAPVGLWRVAVVAESDHAEAIDVAHLEHLRAWSREAFGPSQRTAGVLDHIRKELDEIEAAPDDEEEWADLLTLAFDGAMRAGHEPAAIIAAVKAKQAKNEARTWPDWRSVDPNKAIEHDREDES